MRAGIRTKFLGIIALATLVPLAIAVLAIQTIGYNHLVKERGTAFKAGAAHIAESINMLAQSEVERIYDFLTLERVHLSAAAANQDLAGLPAADLQAQIQRRESRWPSLKPNDPELGSLLQNPLAGELQAFQKQHPLFAEIFVTDREGRLIASTGKTSDYFQADEGWWQRAANGRRGEAWLEGLHFDESSSTFSLDIAVPVITPEGVTVGVLKASLNASPFFSSLTLVLPGERMVRDIVREDGAVLLRLGRVKFLPGSVQMNPQAIAALKATSAGWMVRRLFDGAKSMAGFSPLSIRAAGQDRRVNSGLSSMYVVVHEPAMVALASLRKQVTLLTLAGGALVLLFGGAGLWVANSRIIKPVRMLRSAAEAVAATVVRSGPRPGETAAQEAAARLGCLTEVRTQDELQALARDFGVMGRQVLRYQQQLEEEIAAKTAAIQRDLDMARDFQAALMPRVYPAVPDGDAPDELRLVFHHIYRPASTVGGDFFDVQKISPHQAGVFIADVMGHGARSALITAILRTLLQTNCTHAEDPAALLALVNRQFHEVIRQTHQTVFVTGLYMVVDTLKGQLTCASAGHPSPFLAHRGKRVIEPLFDRLKANPALGLFPAATYTRITQHLEASDLLVLFTDGVIEAANEEGEEFGYTGLRAAIEENLEGTEENMASAIDNMLSRFVEPADLSDDICLVTIDVCARRLETEGCQGKSVAHA